LQGVERSAMIAVSVNGVISSVCRAYEVDGETRFAAFLRPESFAGPYNDISLFVVDDVETGSALPVAVVEG
jgi:hypothetical protein